MFLLYFRGVCFIKSQLYVRSRFSRMNLQILCSSWIVCNYASLVLPELHPAFSRGGTTNSKQTDNFNLKGIKNFMDLPNLWRRHANVVISFEFAINCSRLRHLTSVKLKHVIKNILLSFEIWKNRYCRMCCREASIQWTTRKHIYF